MKLENIKDIINNGGITLDIDGEKMTKTEGFMVSIYGEEVQVNVDNEEGILKAINEKLEKIKKLNKESLYVGVWLDNGVIYVDISIHIIEKNEALEFGKNNKQIAVYDLKNNQSLYIKDYKFIKYYTLYKVIKKNDKIKDIKIIKQVDDLKELKEMFNISYKSLLNGVSWTLEKTKRYFNEEYIIIRDYDIIQ